MTDIECTYPDRDAVLVACLYDDIDPGDRVAFDTHVTTCQACRSELAELRGVRATLGKWAPPEPVRGFSGHRSPVARSRAWWHTVPVWAQVAAAMLVLGVSAWIANLDVRYDHNGLRVRTGWSKAEPGAAPQAQADRTPWRADLTALEQQLRSEMRDAARSAAVTSAAAAPASVMPDTEFRKRVRVLLDESERRQQNELALRLAQAERDWNAQRQADLTKINQNLGYIQNNTYGELLNQRNYLLRASQKQ